MTRIGTALVLFAAVLLSLTANGSDSPDLKKNQDQPRELACLCDSGTRISWIKGGEYLFADIKHPLDVRRTKLKLVDENDCGAGGCYTTYKDEKGVEYTFSSGSDGIDTKYKCRVQNVDCRFDQDTLMSCLTGRRIVHITWPDGEMTYNAFNLDNPGATPQLEIRGVKATQLDPSGKTMRLDAINRTYQYRLWIDKNPRLQIMKNNKVIQTERCIYYTANPLRIADVFIHEIAQ